MTNKNLRKTLGLIEAGGRVAAEDLDADQLGEALADVVHVERLTEHARELLVKALRERGASWADIAQALGVTKQAAQQHYAPLMNNGGRS